jgi:hypothetical protein
MSFLKQAAMPLALVVTGAVYWFLTYEWIGTVLLLIFAVAMGLMVWILGPTIDDVGPTAPVDPDWHERT